MIKSMPPALVTRLDSEWDEFCDSLHQAGLEFIPGQELTRVLFRVWGGSRFIAQICITYPAVFINLLRSGDLNRDYRPVEYRNRLQAILARVRKENVLIDQLRIFRQREIFRIAWRDLAGWAPLSETLRDLSLLADACVDLSLSKLHQWACRKWGEPRTAEGFPQQLVVIGMGKLGAYELNFSSDIDLIFSYPEDGQTRKRKGVSCDEFFSQLGKSLIRVISEATDLGFVFRVDMRLRPYGDSGALVASFSAMEEYYQYQGREWERYAMIKARVIAGDFVAGNALLKTLKPFTYRRYLDYSAFESLRNMKGLITRQVRRKGMEDNIKLGLGGIREIEFIGQAFQLIRGGREPDLQIRGIVQVLERLSKKKYLPAYVTGQLLEAYRFLRKTENHLQAYADQQVHTLPTDEEERCSLAFSMGYGLWDDFYVELGRNRLIVESIFEQTMSAPQASCQSKEMENLATIWLGMVDDSQARKVLEESGYQNSGYALGLVRGLRDSYAYKTGSNIAQERMDRLMPMVLGAVAESDQPDKCLLRVTDLLEKVAGRSTYLALLIENPVALSQVVRLFSRSGWISEYITMHPVLLDELLDMRSMCEPRKIEGLRREIRSLLSFIDADDLEQQMDALRYFKQSNVLHVAAADLTRAMSLVAVSGHLTDIAEVVLEHVIEIAMQHLLKKHGAPVCRDNRHEVRPGFAVIGYGKLGGIEFGYGSDLDLVFLHNSHGKIQKTKGPRVLDNAVFFSRVGQRIIHILDTHTSSGSLYEVDMRLRPNGASGMLVSALDSFRQYMQEEAWIWEHQAMVRARPIAGDPDLIEEFRKIRREILCQQRDAMQLQKEVAGMRERMREELGSKRVDRFHLKQDVGGMADIEFMVQYLVLRWAYQYPQLTEFSDNLRQLNCLGELEILEADTVEGLAEAYKAYRARAHWQVLTDEPSCVPADTFLSSRRMVESTWRCLMIDPVGE
ncbi:MAG TPA: bifunctional [glutamate--ammonia ligase]-adenylyl-L-tyrosine phosphorylase/[glutamate--ammonia-ligase] adenylyltransferase [Gammaproteobacteria bacterium]|nr:bifunctional [glutamate--ammonia ligase]-adenylyl-L-tyrosine phosphorylase/[glutamate--ammonia-ligase] adenylyltransferase [Gammaproteobacteria bacterium]